MIDLTKFAQNLHASSLKKSQAFTQYQTELTNMEVIMIDERWFIKGLNKLNQVRYYRKSLQTKSHAEIISAAYTQLWVRRLASREVDLEKDFVATIEEVTLEDSSRETGSTDVGER